jgi:hypothetical protein
MIPMSLQHRVINDLSRVETCQLFYSNGVEPPKLLIKEVEIALAKDDDAEIDEEGSVPEEDIQAARDKGKAQRFMREQWITDRKAENEKKLAELGGFGNEQVTESED